MLVAMIIAAILAIAATIAVHILILPAGKAQKFGRFGIWLERVFNFRTLLLEKIIRALYILGTMCCIFMGFFMLFCRMGNRYYSQSMFPYGLLLLLLGPIVLRISFESIMLSILKYKVMCEINEKLGPMKPSRPKARPAEPAPRPAYRPDYVTCPNCGERYDANEGDCPNCGAKPEEYDR